MVCMLSNKATVADCGRSMPLRSVSVSVWQSFCLWTSHGTTSPTGMVPFYLDWAGVSMPVHNFFLPLRMERQHTCTRHRALTVYSQNTNVLGKYAIMSVWWRIVSTDRKQDKTSGAGRSKEVDSWIWNMRARSFSRVGRVTYLAPGFWNATHSYEMKTELETCDKWLAQWNTFVFLLFAAWFPIGQPSRWSGLTRF